MADTSFTGIHNFRDVGAAINALRGSSSPSPSASPIRFPALKPKTLYRSGRLDNARAPDRAKLRDVYQVQTVIDLRTKSEHMRQGTGRGSGPEEASWPWKTVYVEFVGRRFELSMLWQLSGLQMTKFLGLMAIGKRMEAIHILGENVLKPRGLVRLSRDSLRYCQPGICAALDAVISAQNERPVLVHCTQGKDRSGLVVMLILFALRIPLGVVTDEYTMSEAGLAPVRATMIQEVSEMGMDEAYTRAPPEVPRAVWDFLQKEYGGVDRYLDGIGFGEAKRKRLREMMLA
ncbi:Tyrosine serine protein [Mycena kentingensis (nom. inval.)]|nr:Tyrosine serine protein [Mycena kentingensis (nom. inval.)]